MGRVPSKQPEQRGVPCIYQSMQKEAKGVVPRTSSVPVASVTAASSTLAPACPLALPPIIRRLSLPWGAPAPRASTRGLVGRIRKIWNPRGQDNRASDQKHLIPYPYPQLQHPSRHPLKNPRGRYMPVLCANHRIPPQRPMNEACLMPGFGSIAPPPCS